MTGVAGEVVAFTGHFHFSDDHFPSNNAELLSHMTLRFRPEATLRSSMKATGFEVQAM
ncbi:hypothetical protein [Deinococcus arenicola]|uniref:Uncharacterized protein n=1 Tax=Deinococcus arenicola TaxID=2994950 RepID=A0ABU4DRU4_9DEIO|nr:hypothetical protein [Deinococcus sp. ZS9-10]MDV6375144.1 hypothetical protein [Deinococcus sp. ZS9-10]